MISVLRFHLPVCIKENSFLTKKENLLARVPKLAISLSCLSRFLSGTLGQSRSAGNMSFPPPVREKQSDTAGSSFAKRERGSKNTILKAIRPSLSARFHLLTIMHAIHDSHMFHHKVLRSPALRRARLWFWNICPLFSRQEPWKQTGTGNADFCAWLGTPLPWIRTQTKNESGTNAEQDRHVLTAIPPILGLPRHSVRYGKGYF